jgi:single-strand DNA-binding protein
MKDLNSVFLIGHLTRDMVLEYLQSGTAMGKISLAVNRSVKKNDQWTDEASFFDVSLFGKQAESLKQSLVKGKQIAVCGELKQDRWEKDGQKFSKVQIVANNVQLLGGKGDISSQGAQQQAEDFPEDLPFDF